ncbi:MAG: DNA primase catalytic subunit PriS [Candidatus Micrarchaeota archaeon]|nr:DNA primase catalytic subunit PriS [Candidatus Micrarchaeota archaeon]
MLAQQQTPEEKYVKDAFMSYYKNRSFSVPEVHQREFGFGGWERKIEFRHIKIGTNQELSAKLAVEAPFYISYSVSYYQFPDARPMPKKAWLGADLVFDLDAKTHECGKFTCERCLQEVKREALRLIEDFLVADFGLSKKEMVVNFSGSRGYHVHVISNEVKRLDREARREIADYVAGVGVSFERLFWKEGKKLFGPNFSSGGYGEKFAKAFCSKLNEDAFALFFSRKLKLNEEKERLIGYIQKGEWGGVGVVGFERKLEEKFKQMLPELSVNIDANVTADITKLIRMPESLHGGSGLAAKKVSQLDSFDPLKDAVVFRGGEAKIRMSETVPAFQLDDQTFGPFEAGETALLPQSAAIFLLCKKAAVLA